MPQGKRLKTLKPRVATLQSRLATAAPESWRAGLTSTQRGYGYHWQQYRLVWLRRHPLCGDRLDGPSHEHSLCLQQGRATPATDVDHIQPHRGDQALFWDERNHQSLCGHCHDTVKARIERGG